MEEETQFLVEQLEKCQEEVVEILSEVKTAKQGVKAKLLERANSTISEMKEAVKHLEGVDLKQARKWKKELKAITKTYDDSQGNYLFGADEESGLFDNDADHVVRNQIGALQKANRQLMQANEYGEKTNEELHRIKNKFQDINQKNLELVGEVNTADGLVNDINKLISRNKKIFKRILVFVSVVVLLLLYLKLFRN